MAVQILSYVGLLYQDLIRSGQLMASGQIPPVLPLVLYNGVTCWQAPEEAPAAGVYGVAEAGIFAWTRARHGGERMFWRHRSQDSASVSVAAAKRNPGPCWMGSSDFSRGITP